MSTIFKRQSASGNKQWAKNYSLFCLLPIAYCLFFLSVSTSAFSQTVQDAIQAVRNEQLVKAKNILLQIISKTPAGAETFYRLGNIYYSLGKKDSAAFYYLKGIKPEDKTNYNQAGLGKLALDEKNELKAQEYFGKLTGSGKSRDCKAYTFAGEAYWNSSLKDVTRALPMLEKAIGLDIKNVEAQLLLGEIYLNAKPSNAGKAVTSYEYAIEADPKNAFAYMKIGMIYMSAKNYEEAHEHFKKGSAADPDFIPLYRELADFNYLAKRYDDAIKFQKEYIDRSGSDAEKLSAYAKYLFMNKDYENTIGTIENVMKQDSSNVILSRLIGYSYYEQGKYPEGLAYMKRFFAKADTSKIIGSDYAYYGKLLAKNGSDSLAVIYLNKAITLDSTNADLYYDLGMTLYSQKKNLESAAVFEKMLTIKSGTSQDYFQLGRAYYWGASDSRKLLDETKDKEEKTKLQDEAEKSFAMADTAFMKVTEMQPASPTGFLWRARSNSQLDPESEKGLSLPHYLKFIELAEAAPDPAKFKKELLEAYSYLGYYYAIITENMAEAKKAWKKVQELDPENQKAKEFFKQLNNPQPKN